MPTIYYLPKVHKLLHPPHQPIVGGIDSVTPRIGRFVDNFLQPLGTKTPAFLKDSMQIINEIPALTLGEGTLLVTPELSSLYTIIPHMIGYQSARYFLVKDKSLDVPQMGVYFEVVLIHYGT